MLQHQLFHSGERSQVRLVIWWVVVLVDLIFDRLSSLLLSHGFFGVAANALESYTLDSTPFCAKDSMRSGTAICDGDDKAFAHANFVQSLLHVRSGLGHLVIQKIIPFSGSAKSC
jgi:hypothetical protein